MRDPRVDFYAVFDDLAYLGLVGQPLADRLRMRLALMLRIASGTKNPAPIFADRIVELWVALTGKPLQFLPRTTDPIGARRDTIHGIELDEQPEPSFIELQAIVIAWAQISARG